MEGESGEQVGGELESVTSSAGVLCKAGGMRLRCLWSIVLWQAYASDYNSLVSVHWAVNNMDQETRFELRHTDNRMTTGSISC